MEKYDHKATETKWQEKWQAAGLNKTGDDPTRPKCYVLDMFPYPSGEGLHVGHPKGYIATDVYSRLKKMQGHNILHPMGWDAFGLPAENYALKNKVHPKVAVDKNITTFKSQLKEIGLNYDREKEINTTDPEYYKWTQYIFLKLLERGLAYQSHEPINWCPSCQTGLANEDLENGKCERCGSEVEKKPMRQWVLKITDYADRLLKDLDISELKWPEYIKESQRHWIGRSEGAEIEFELNNFPLEPKLKIFTTRADTIFGVTFLAVSPELANKWLESTWTLDVQVKDYIVKTLAERAKQTFKDNPEKTGIFSGIYAINPANNEKVPVWVTNYVLADVGTGAVMAVPAHDERDWEFAKKYNLPIKQVIYKQDSPIKSYLMGAKSITDDDLNNLGVEIVNKKDDGDREIIIPEQSLGKYEKLISEKLDTGFWNEYVGQEIVFLFKNKDGSVDRIILNDKTQEAIDKKAAEFVGEDWNKQCVWKWLAENSWYRDLIIHENYGILINSGNFNGLASEEAKKKITEKFGQPRVTYKLKDWVFSRQRYWGEPIPVVHCSKCGVVLVPESELPVKLPEVEHYEPTGTGESPLANITDWVNVKCPKCGGEGRRETNTMPQWAGSSWYYLAYIMRVNNKSKNPNSKYSDLVLSASDFNHWLPVDVYVGGAEHATRHLIYARFWHKFLYDLGIVSNLEPFTELHNVGLILAEDGRKMSKRFGNIVNPDDVIELYGADSLRLYTMFMGPFAEEITWSTNNIIGVRRFLEKVWRLKEKVNLEVELPSGSEASKSDPILHQTIKKVTEDILNFRFNTAISALMIQVNAWEKADMVNKEDYETLLKLLAPFAPHLTDELWEQLDHTESIHLAKWPEYDINKLGQGSITISVQVNGRVRSSLEIEIDASEEAVKALALKDPKVTKWLADHEVKRVIFVKNRTINFIV